MAEKKRKDFCTECRAEMSIPGLIDKNIQEVEEQYRTTKERTDRKKRR